MAKEQPHIPLPLPIGGVNFHVGEARPDQIVDGIDVIEEDGDLRRRPAFSCIHTGPIRLLPAGMTMLVANGAISYDRVFNQAANTIGAADLFVGATERFNGIDWRHVTSNVTDPTENRLLRPRYWSIAQQAWVPIPWVLDTTMRRALTGSNSRIQPLFADGRISWHLAQFFADWGTTAVQGETIYWVRLDVVDPEDINTPTNLSGTTSLRIELPGARAFVLDPVQTIDVQFFRGGGRQLIIGSDRMDAPGGVMPGANLGVARNRARRTESLRRVLDRGAGVWGLSTWPANWEQRAPGAGWANAEAAGGTEGVAGETMTKLDNTYDWFAWTGPPRRDQFAGYLLRDQLTPTGGFTNNAGTLRGSFSFAAISGLRNNAWRGCLIVCTVRSGAGPLVGEAREIFGNTSTSVQYHRHFSATPDANNRFAIFRRPPELIVRSPLATGGLDPRDYLIERNDADTVYPFQNVGWAPDRDTIWAAPASRYLHFSVEQPLPWDLEAGKSWGSMFDTITGKILLSNGRGLLEYDGRHLRNLPATSDPANPRIQQWLGIMEENVGSLSPEQIAGSQIAARPPAGSVLSDYLGRIMVAGIPGRPFAIKWSAPGQYNDIWPLAYETEIRDSDNLPIVGMSTLYSRLYVWTTQSIHEGSLPDEAGLISFKPKVQGIGFVSARGVARVVLAGNQMLVGASGDGLTAFDGQECRPLLGAEDWSKIVPGGVNTARLSQIVAAASRQDSCVYFAVPGPGSPVNNRIIRWNYDNNSFWLWSAPFGGVSSLARDYDAHGRERVLFGFNDGHVGVLCENDTDDGSAVTGRARSAPTQPAALRENKFNRLHVSAKHGGAAQSITVRAFVDRSLVGESAQPKSFGSNASEWNVALWNTGVWANGVFKNEQVRFPNGTRGESFQWEAEGTWRWVIAAAELLLQPAGHPSA